MAAAGREDPTAVLWIMLLTGAATLGTWAVACATPFAALATLAALRMRARDGLALILLSWAMGQGIGFGLLHYPHDRTTILWGAVLGLAAVAGTVAARSAANVARDDVVRLPVAFLAALSANKAVIVVVSLRLGGLHLALSPRLALRQSAIETVTLVALLLLHHALRRTGLPAVTAPRSLPA